VSTAGCGKGCAATDVAACLYMDAVVGCWTSTVHILLGGLKPAASRFECWATCWHSRWIHSA
jgi:hypothetical protein